MGIRDVLRAPIRSLNTPKQEPVAGVVIVAGQVTSIIDEALARWLVAAIGNGSAPVAIRLDNDI